MGELKYDLAVAYRVHPKSSRSAPPAFKNDKFKLVELCFKSFKTSLDSLKVKLWILVDNCPVEYENMFRQVWKSDDLTFVRFQGITGAAALKEQIRILTEQSDSEVVYCAEDDYFYLAGQFQMAVDFLNQNPAIDFISPYDHPDIHTTDLHNEKSPSKQFGGKVWNSCCSTTHTFLTTRSTLRECQDVLRVTKASIPDLAQWLALTKRRVFDIKNLLKWCVTHQYWAASIMIAWNYYWTQILFGRQRTLWIPHPSIATHMAVGMEAPGVDWQKFIGEQTGASQEKRVS